MKQEKNYTEDAFFFDSYALFEIIKGNENYENYTNSFIITTKLNLFELYHGLLRDESEKLADIVFDKYYKFVVDFGEDVIKEAAKMKVKLGKRTVSMTDCIGYILSKQLSIKFLTGDKEFEGFNNVEFVK